MAYSFRSVGTYSRSTGALTPGMPAGFQSGDLLLIFTCARGAETLATPSGWQLLSPDVQTSQKLFGRIAAGGDTAPAIDWSSTGQSYAQICAFSGSVYTDLSTIVAQSIDKTSTSVDMVYNTLTVTTQNCLMIAAGRHNKTVTSDGVVANALTGFTEISQTSDAGSTSTFYWGYQQQSTATNLTTTNQTLTIAESLGTVTMYVGLQSGTQPYTLMGQSCT